MRLELGIVECIGREKKAVEQSRVEFSGVQQSRVELSTVQWSRVH